MWRFVLIFIDLYLYLLISVHSCSYLYVCSDLCSDLFMFVRIYSYVVIFVDVIYIHIYTFVLYNVFKQVERDIYKKKYIYI